MDVALAGQRRNRGDRTQESAQIAHVIGFGMTQNRNHVASMSDRYGFSAEWLGIEPGQSVGALMQDQKTVLGMQEGRM